MNITHLTQSETPFSHSYYVSSNHHYWDFGNPKKFSADINSLPRFFYRGTKSLTPARSLWAGSGFGQHWCKCERRYVFIWICCTQPSTSPFYICIYIKPVTYFHTRKPKSPDLHTCTQQALFSVSNTVLPDTLEKTGNTSVFSKWLKTSSSSDRN